MLGKIRLIPDKVKEHVEHLKQLVVDFKDSDNDSYNFFKRSLSEFEKSPLSVDTLCELNSCDEYRNTPDGFLVGDLNNSSYIDGLTQYRKVKRKNISDFETVEEYVEYNRNQRSFYGVCDNADQILEHCPILKEEDRIFLVHMTPIFKEEQSEYGGWRWHKWGKYIGTHEIKHEYLYDEDIDMVFVYHIYEVEED